jgi:hypothetical protein
MSSLGRGIAEKAHLPGKDSRDANFSNSGLESSNPETRRKGVPYKTWPTRLCDEATSAGEETGAT